MSKRPLQVSPFLAAAQSTSSEVFDYHIWVFSWLSDAVEASTLGFLTLHRETKFIIGFDFAVTFSSPASSCILFDITSRQLVEPKWLTLIEHKRWFHSSRVKFHLVTMSASWFLVSMYLIWIFGSNLIRSNNQSRATLWVLETGLIFLEIAGLARDSYHGKQRVSPFYHGSDSCFQELRRPDPINQVREYRLISILHPKWFLILLNCAKLKFVSYTSNWLEQMYDFQKRTMCHLM